MNLQAEATQSETASPPSPAPFAIRDGVATDIPFVFRSWLTSYRRSSFARGIRDRIYFANEHKAIERILRSCSIRVACINEDPEIILGYVVLGPSIVHYAFTKPAFRRMHILTRLLPDGDLEYTHRTEDSDRVLARLPRLTYNPYLALGGRDG